MVDQFTERYGDLLTGGYDCVGRIVLNAYFPLRHAAHHFKGVQMPLQERHLP